MKKITLIIALGALLLAGGSCKRAAVDDPDIIVPPNPGTDLTSVTLTGTVTGDAGSGLVPVGGAMISLAGTTPGGSTFTRSATTDATGFYSLTNVTFGSTVTLTPSKDDASEWNPETIQLASVSANVSGLNFTCKISGANQITLSGLVQAYDYSMSGGGKLIPVEDVLITLKGKTADGNDLSRNAMTGSTGIYSIAIPTGSTDVTLTPYKVGYDVWAPASISLPEISGSVSQLNFVGEPTDWTPPTLSIDFPAEGTIYLTDFPMPITIKCEDAQMKTKYPVVTINVTPAVGSFSKHQITQPPYVFLWHNTDNEIVVNHYYTISVTAIDEAGNRATLSKTYYIELTKTDGGGDGGGGGV